MLSLWKLRVGVEAYYLSQVASGLNDYYTGAGEAVGEWIGGGVEGLGVAGEVSPDDLRAVLAGLAPGTALTPNGTQLRVHPRHVPGFDLTFSVPKSVSIVYALGDPRLQGAVIEASQAAVRDTLSWLEREACFVRRGSNSNDGLNGAGGTRRMVAAGFVAAEFRHRTSRAGDPQLHHHVLVANLAQGIDGKWSALDATAIYQARRTASAVFHTTLRYQLTERLGVEWGPVHNDIAEIAGVPANVRREFSQRRVEIEEWLEVHGRSGPVAAAEATLATRRRKPDAPEAGLDEIWKQRAIAVGWGPTELEQLATTWEPRTPTLETWLVRDRVVVDGQPEWRERATTFEEWVTRLVDERLCGADSTFTRHELTQAIAGALPAATTTQIEQVANRAMAAKSLVPIGVHSGHPGHVAGPTGPVRDTTRGRWTSRHLLDIESQYLRQLDDGQGSGAGQLDASVVADAIAARPGLGPDQAAAIALLCSTGNTVDVLVGRAGTGKTYTLGTVRSAYEAAGWTVIGVAPSARAARELETGADISAQTIARFLHSDQTLSATTLLVVDEAGMAATRDLARLVDATTRSGAKAILVGDHHQLPEIEAGGAFRAALGAAPGSVAELTINRRQHEPWEQEALDQLRHGDPTVGLAAYRSHGRVTTTTTPDALHARVVADWSAKYGAGDTLLLAGTRTEARLLNARARHHLRETSQLRGDDHQIGGHAFAVGDRIVLLHNRHDQRTETGAAARVENGTLATITNIDGDGGLSITTSDERRLVLDADYARRHVDHGYALTIHKAQGVTCDHVLVVGPAGLYREAIYVALSRARQSAHLYATPEQIAEFERHDRGLPLPGEAAAPSPDEAIDKRLQRSGAKHLATHYDPNALAVADLCLRYSVAELSRRAQHATTVEAGSPYRPNQRWIEADQAADTRRHIEIGQQVRAHDRHNIGTVTSINDTDGTASIAFGNAKGRSAHRTIEWHQLSCLDSDHFTEMTPAAEQTLQALRHVAEQESAAHEAHLAEHGVRSGDSQRYRAAAHASVDRHVAAWRADPPTWTHNQFGDRPTDHAGAVVWDDTIYAVVNWRELHGVAPEAEGLGPVPLDAEGAESWRRAQLRLDSQAQWLSERPSIERSTVELTTEAAVARRQELRQLMSSAPADQQAAIEHLLRARINPDELQPHLETVLGLHEQRQAWIIRHLHRRQQRSCRPQPLDDHGRCRWDSDGAVECAATVVGEHRIVDGVDRVEGCCCSGL
jgi:conjugative relaxase-like TrwC/TraI family protein